MGKLDQKVILITGANQGIGKGMAQLFASEGARLAIRARNAQKLDAVADELTAAGTQVVSQPTDVLDRGLQPSNAGVQTAYVCHDPYRLDAQLFLEKFTKRAYRFVLDRPSLWFVLRSDP